MIVLGPNISTHHLLESNDGGDTDEQNYDTNSCIDDSVEPSPTTDNYLSMSSVPQELQMIGEDLIHLLNDTRIKCSQELGLIGAPPLSSSSTIGKQSTRQLTNTNITTPRDDSSSDDTKTSSQQSSITYHNDLNCIYNMATTHINLIQTMNNILEPISLGTSLRLGLGPTSCNTTRGSSISNGRLVARVEKNWIARQQQQQTKRSTSNAQSIKSNLIANVHQHHQKPPVRLTLQKIRNILHQTIVDYAISLQEILKHTMTDSQFINSTTEWDDFVSDLQHSMKSKSNPHILTISQLTTWINNLGTFLSFVLSTILDRNGSTVLLLVSNSLIMASVKQSVQFANERIAFLHSACPLTRPSADIDTPTDTGIDTSTNNTCPADDNNIASNISRNQQKRQAEQLIQNLQDTLDAARVSLWAFEQSYIDQDDTGNDTPSSDRSESNYDTAESDDMTTAWWSQFKDLMTRSQSSIPEFENQFLSTTVDEDAEQEEAVVEENISDLSASRQVTTECSELISTATGEELPPTTTAADVESHPSLPVNKTLVFSGSGTKSFNKKRIVLPTPAEQEGDCKSPPPVFNSADQMRLLQDLQKRIKTMGLAEEHVVVNADPHAEMIDTEDRLEEEQAKGSAALSSNKGNDKRQSQSCFLGVSGSLLAELSSTIGKSSLTSPEE